MILGRVFALLACLTVLGCAPGRMADLKDSGRISAGIALGLSVDVRLGDLSHPAVGLASSGAMIGYDSRDVDGAWFEARVSDPFAIHWYRREGASWGFALNASGWRGVWESLGFLDALDEFDEPFDQEPLPETGSILRGEMLDGNVSVSRWLPIPGGPDPAPLVSFNTATDLQVGATLLLLGARAGFNPLEFLDFLLGFAGQDIAGDDPQD